MRNLKKILALVLALVMVIGMMSIASAATPGTGYTDDADITKFDESIQILTALGIYKGDGEGKFEPNDPITRAEVAALVYRIVHDEKYVGIYADYDKFDDVNSKDWFAGYVNYCANGEFIVGDGRGNFNPDDYVDGYQVLAIVLRAIGYDREGEFQGAGWEVRTARKAKELGITKNIVDGTLGAPATRAMVAELIYRAIAQTSTVSWTLLGSYKANYETLAYANFGLCGDKDGTIAKEANKDGVLVYDADDYALMTTNEDAVAESTRYGEPVSYWKHNSYPYVVTVRYNPVASYTTKVVDGTVYAALAALGLDPSGVGAIGVDSFWVDGEDETNNANDTVYVKYPALGLGSAPVYATGNGVATEVFVADGDVFVVAKNTYIGEITKGLHYDNTADDYVITMNGVDYVDSYAVTKALTKDARVLYNVSAKGPDIYTFHTPATQVITVGSTYDSANYNTAYFKAGNTKYTYNVNYHIIENSLPVVSGNVADIMNGKAGDVDGTDAIYGLGDKVEVYFDDFGNVILLDEVATYNNGGVGVVIAADTVRVSLGKYVMELDMIMADGSKKTVKAITISVEDWADKTRYNEQEVDDVANDLMDKGAFLTQYVIDAETGYYVLTAVDGIANTFGVYGADTGAQIVRGDANAADLSDAGHANGLVNLDVDSTTTYIVETYKNDGKDIKGYTTYKGFKSVPSLKDLGCDYDYSITWTYNTYSMSYVVFVTGATKGDQPETVTIPELVYVMDNVPEKSLVKDEDGNTVVYWTYTVVKNGQVTTLKSTSNPDDEVAKTGLYEVTKDVEAKGFYKLEPMTDNQATLAEYSALIGVTYGDVLYCTNVKYTDAAFDKLTLANSVKVYDISGTTLTEIALTDLDDGMLVEYLVDKYGYITTIFVVHGPTWNNDLDGAHEQ